MEPNPRSRLEALIRPLLYAFPALLFVSSIRLPAYVATDALDPSWQQALGELLRSGARAGVDYVFPYGPLGSLLFITYDRELFWLKYAWEIGSALVSVLLLTRFARRFATNSVRLLFFAAALVFLVQAEELVNVCLVLAALSWIDDRRERAGVLVAASAYVAVMGLAKFTFLLLGTTLVAVSALPLALARRRGRATAVVLLHLGIWLAGWLAAGQSPGDIAAYLRGSFELALGFSAGMGQSGSTAELALALLLLALVAASIAFRSLPRSPSREVVFSMVVIAIGLLLSFKHGFTRHNVHAVIFFRYSAIVPFLLVGAAAGSRWRGPVGRALLLATAGLGAVGVFVVLLSVATPRHVALHAPRLVKLGIGNLLRPDLVHDRLEAARDRARREFALPAIRDHVGEDTVDLLSSGQGVVFLNDLRWNPRPVFQSYTAYTAALLRRNAEHFSGRTAPDHVLLDLKPIDGRLLTHEDGLALLSILRFYRPSVREGPYRLLDRVAPPDAVRPAGAVVLRRRAGWDEEVALAGAGPGYHTLTLAIRSSGYGRLRGFLLRPPRVMLQVTTADGRTWNHRIVPDMAREEFLLSPLCESQEELLDLYDGPSPGDTPRRVVSLRLVTPERRAFAAEVEITVRAYPTLTDRSL